MRVFAALRPPADVLKHLDAALSGVRAGSGLSLRWSDPAQWHLTLAFHPALPAGALEGVADELAHTARRHAPLDLALHGAGEFGHRTLWIGVAGQTAQLADLMAEDLLGEGSEDGTDGAARGGRRDPRERRRAHLTVARVSARAPRAPRRCRRGEAPEPDPTRMLLDSAVNALSVYRGPTWRARQIELLASHLGEGRGGGPRHEVLATVPLGG